jgi:two-component system chemotaxis sensor kinase CheA
MSVAAARALGDASAFHALFFEEADEHLAAIEGILLRIDPAAAAVEDLNAIFRAAHSIKGSSAMLGFPEIASLTHVLENLLDILRKGERALTREDVDALLRAGDVVKMQLAFRRGGAAAAPDVDGTENELRALAAAAAAPLRRYAVRLGPLAAPIEAAELETMLAGLAGMGEVHDRHLDNTAGGEIRFGLALAGGEHDLRSVLTLVVAPDLVHIGAADVAAGTDATAESKDDELFVDPAQWRRRADPEPADVDLFVTPQAWRASRGAGRRASDDPVVPAEREGRREADRHVPGTQGDTSSIRVSVEKIDQLVNLVGELVITEAMLAQQHGGSQTADGHAELAGLGDLARHTRNLQEAVMAIRMVPISAVFSRFPRLVRELAQRLGKEVEIKLSGEATELDRGLTEKLVDPLTHLVRNAIDHGLERPEARLAAGKSRGGSVSLAASQRAGRIVIEVRDDGRGLDRARILARAAERGAPIATDAPDHEVWQLIFEAGFSTAESVTDVSGRGVGMDVVRRNIQLLGGTVDLTSSAGTGTTVTVSVPLTLAIVEAMTVAAGGQTYVVPLASVVESRRVGRDDIRGIAGLGCTLRVRDDYLPVRRLAEQFSHPHDGSRGGEIAVIVEVDGARAALLVDALIGQQQVVVKSLEANFRRIPGIAGATIMGDGKVALILDMAHLVSQAGRGPAVLH